MFLYANSDKSVTKVIKKIAKINGLEKFKFLNPFNDEKTFMKIENVSIFEIFRNPY